MFTWDDIAMQLNMQLGRADDLYAYGRLSKPSPLIVSVGRKVLWCKSTFGLRIR